MGGQRKGPLLRYRKGREGEGFKEVEEAPLGERVQIHLILASVSG
jgi:hypothetical protein